MGLSAFGSLISKSYRRHWRSERGYLRLDVDGKRGKVSLKSSRRGRQRAREMDETLGSGSHTGQISE